MHYHGNHRTARPEGLVERAVHEAIDAIAAPDMRERVIDRALRLDHRVEVPESGADVGEFLRGPLYEAMNELLGEGAASAVRQELAPLAERLGQQDLGQQGEVSQVRPSWPRLEIDLDDLLDAEEHDDHYLSFEPPPLVIPSNDDAAEPAAPDTVRTDPAPRGELPVVLVASCDPSSVSLLSFALSGSAYVEVARDVLAVLEGLGHLGAGPLVILDARHPTIQADTLVAMSPELPPGTRVLLWSGDWELERLATLGPGMPDGWVHCGLDASASDVAAVCRVLLG